MASGDHGLVGREVVVGHTIEPEVGDGVLLYLRPVECSDLGHRFDSLLDVANKEAGDAFLDELRHRSAPVGDDGRATRHRLDDAIAEWLLEADEVQQRDGAAEHVWSELRPDGAEVAHPHAVDRQCDDVVVVPPILDDPSDDQRQAGPAGDLDGVGGALSGWTRPKNNR